MIPFINSAEDIWAVMRRNRRYRRKGRVLALRACRKQLEVLRLAKKVSPEEAMRIRQQLLPMLKREELRLAEEESLPEVKATSQAKAYAAEMGVDLSKVPFEGPMITKGHVREYVSAASQ
jgi:hypothetical protein